jgi:competence ComEA-like helix-hairpin-helix protein
MRFWDTFQEKRAWGKSLLLKSGMLGLGLVVVLLAGWPHPQPAAFDHASAPLLISESSTIQKASYALMPLSAVSRSESSKFTREEGKEINLQAAHVPYLVDLNGSSRMELETLPGIGMVLADRIVSYRATHGEFKQIDDLVKVSGIGEKRIKRLEPFGTVQSGVIGRKS